MYELMVSSQFSSAHRLRNYQGKCASLHGHNWKVEVYLESEMLDNLDMVRDAGKVKGILDKFLKNLDHLYLNRLPYFRQHNPSSEMIARFIYTHLKKSLPLLKKVRVWESERVAATYRKSEIKHLAP